MGLDNYTIQESKGETKMKSYCPNCGMYDENSGCACEEEEDET